MSGYFYIVVVAVGFWIAGYFAPEAVSQVPIQPLNTYVCLPKWLNGIFRRKTIEDFPDGVISTRALGAQISSLLVMLLYVGHQFKLPFLCSKLMSVYGTMICIFVGFTIALIVRSIRPYHVEQSNSGN